MSTIYITRLFPYLKPYGIPSLTPVELPSSFSEKHRKSWDLKEKKEARKHFCLSSFFNFFKLPSKDLIDQMLLCIQKVLKS